MSECDLFSLSSSMLKHHEVLVACCYPDADTGFHGFATYGGETIHSLVARVTVQSPWRITLIEILRDFQPFRTSEPDHKISYRPYS